MDITILKEKVLALAKITIEIVENERLHNNLEYVYESYVRIRVKDFRYDDSGTHVQKTIEPSHKPILNNLPKLLTEVQKSEAYCHLDDFLKANLPSGEPELQEISFFVQRIIKKYCDVNAISQSEIEMITKGFISDLTKKPAESGAIVQLVGLILRPEEIELGLGVKIRKPRKEDFETERPVFYSIPEYQYPNPTAFLEIFKQTSNPGEIQTEIEKAVTLLQLFRLGSVKHTTYRMNSSSRTLFGNVILSSGDTNYPVYSYIVDDVDSEKLQHFWTKFSEELPLEFYQSGGQDKNYISIAFDRYKDALIHTGINERRITNIMMGLEALYFKETERMELDYRLRMRMAKVLGMLSYDPILIKSTIKEAYNIRSIFSHGGLLGMKEKDRCLREFPGGLAPLTKFILDLLRVSLIISIVIKKNKTDFVDLIDNSMVNEKDNQSIITVLDPVKDIEKITK